MTYYDEDAYSSVKKIDSHVHLNTSHDAIVGLASKDNFQLLTINVDYSDFPPVGKQFEIARGFKASTSSVLFAATFEMDGWETEDGIKRILRDIDEAIAQGAVAIKVWKNIGMGVKDSKGNNLMIDDPRLDPIFNHLELKDTLLIGHQGEPRNCWLPLEQMTVRNDRDYFEAHPHYHMYQHPDQPTYEEQMAARDRRLARHPRLRFMGAHFASLEWSVDLLAEFLDRFPLAVVDMASRMGQLQVQSQANRDKVVKFLHKYADRVLYATDLHYMPEEDAAKEVQAAHERWVSDWNYLTSDKWMRVAEVEDKFQGLRLPKDVVDNLYYLNAKKLFPFV